MSGHDCPECGESFPSSSCALGGSVGHDCKPRPRDVDSLIDAQDALDGKALDWLMDWVMAADHQANAHYWHITDGKAATCGCAYEEEESE